MRNLKRALSLALASVMVLGLMIVGSSAASGSGFKDYDEVNYKEAADVLNAIGIFIGDENGNFNPDQTLTRAMAAKIVATMILGEDNAEKLPANDNIFKDIDKNTASWAGGYIAYCANNGFIAGDGTGNFNPNGELTGVAFGKVLLTALGYNAKIEGYIDTPSWAINVASAMVETEIDVDGVALNDPITREQAAQMLSRHLWLNTIAAST